MRKDSKGRQKKFLMANAGWHFGTVENMGGFMSVLLPKLLNVGIALLFKKKNWGWFLVKAKSFFWSAHSQGRWLNRISNSIMSSIFSSVIKFWCKTNYDIIMVISNICIPFYNFPRAFSWAVIFNPHNNVVRFKNYRTGWDLWLFLLRGLFILLCLAFSYTRA